MAATSGPKPTLSDSVAIAVDTTSQRAKVLELFEKHRAAPGAPFEEQRFLEFLIADPKKPRAVYDSFRGLRRFNAFINDVQLELAVCFSQKDREANHSLTKFVERVAELQASRRGSLTSLKNQVRAGPGWRSLVVGNIVLFALTAGLWRYGWPAVIVVLLAVVMNGAFLRFAHSERTYFERLRARIDEAGG
jgi:hypothetical protein